MIPQNIKDKLLKFDFEKTNNFVCAFNRSDWDSSGLMLQGARYQHNQLLPAIEMLIKIVEIQGEALETALNYLYWREDDLVGDDLIGDQKLTSNYKARVKVLEKAQSQVAELLKELESLK